jgi:hypothetical protein
MSSKSGIGIGSILSVGSGGTSETFQAVGEVTDVKWSGYKLGTVDSTSLSSTNSEVIGTIIDYGDVTIEGKFLPMDVGQQDIGTYFTAAVLRDWQLQLPKLDGQTTKGNLIAFTGWIVEYTPVVSVQADKPLTFSAKIKINAAPVVTVGS